LPQVDLKGHTIEELAAAANVTVDVIQAAIKMRQQQLLLEKKSYANQLKQKISNHVTVQTSTATIRTTQPTTTTTRPSTTPIIERRKVSRHQIAGGHKVGESII
jgi:hypothetical protein